MRRRSRAEIIVTDKPRSCAAVLKEPGAKDRQDTGRCPNHGAENSRMPFRRRERAMLRFRRKRSQQKFVAVPGSVCNHFKQERHFHRRQSFK